MSGLPVLALVWETSYASDGNNGRGRAAPGSAQPLSAGELKSGIPVGGRMPKYKATKLGGGYDGVELGKSLCYT